MNLSELINEDLKNAMRAKDQVALRGIRAIKSAILLLNTQEGGKEITQEDELNLLAKLAKQRKDSMEIFKTQDRMDLYQTEAEELAIIEKYLPKQLSEEEVNEIIAQIVASSGAAGMKDMGKVMGIASQELKGKADGKLISEAVKRALA